MTEGIAVPNWFLKELGDESVLFRAPVRVAFHNDKTLSTSQYLLFVTESRIVFFKHDVSKRMVKAFAIMSAPLLLGAALAAIGLAPHPVDDVLTLISGIAILVCLIIGVIRAFRIGFSTLIKAWLEGLKYDGFVCDGSMQLSDIQKMVHEPTKFATFDIYLHTKQGATHRVLFFSPIVNFFTKRERWRQLADELLDQWLDGLTEALRRQGTHKFVRDASSQWVLVPADKVRAKCPSCNKAFHTDAKHVGAKAKCPKCGGQFVITDSPNEAYSDIQT